MRLEGCQVSKLFSTVITLVMTFNSPAFMNIRYMSSCIGFSFEFFATVSTGISFLVMNFSFVSSQIEFSLESLFTRTTFQRSIRRILTQTKENIEISSSENYSTDREYYQKRKEKLNLPLLVRQLRSELYFLELEPLNKENFITSIFYNINLQHKIKKQSNQSRRTLFNCQENTYHVVFTTISRRCYIHVQVHVFTVTLKKSFLVSKKLNKLGKSIDFFIALRTLTSKSAVVNSKSRFSANPMDDSGTLFESIKLSHSDKDSMAPNS